MLRSLTPGDLRVASNAARTCAKDICLPGSPDREWYNGYAAALEDVLRFVKEDEKPAATTQAPEPVNAPSDPKDIYDDPPF